MRGDGEKIRGEIWTDRESPGKTRKYRERQGATGRELERRGETRKDGELSLIHI